MLEVVQIFKVGPRKITRTGSSAAVYLGREFMQYVGRRVLLTVEILEDVHDNPRPKIKENLSRRR